MVKPAIRAIYYLKLDEHGLAKDMKSALEIVFVVQMLNIDLDELRNPLLMDLYGDHIIENLLALKK